MASGPQLLSLKGIGSRIKIQHEAKRKEQFMIKKIMRRLNQKGGGIGERGQVAIFVALIFQVLFVFFAMVVNIGLLVHHKINLQNSVDLAAYYGGMKQAEVMNGIAHMNYQLKQAYKLLVWRYRHMGMAGDTFNHPYDSLSNSLRSAATLDQPFRAADGSKCQARFCVSYPVFDIQEPNEYYCRDVCKGVKITLLGIPSVSSVNFGLAEGILGGLARSIEDASKQFTDKSQKHCRKYSALNWFALARFILAYRQEMIARKQTLNLLANSISAETADLTDLDGESVRKGVLATFYRNLSYPNQEGIDPATGTSAKGKFNFYNALGHNACSGAPGERRVPPKWLNEMFIKPLYVYLEGNCDGSKNVGYEAMPMYAANVPKYTDGLDPNVVTELKRLMQEPSDLGAADNRLWHSTVGYEKNPWCMAYVAVEAETSPKIPFSPFGPVKLKARSFAKPFGGRIGPWYFNKWPSGDVASRGGNADKIDATLPPRVVSGETAPPFTEDDADVDFARYTGDRIGTKSTMTMGQIAKGLWDPYHAPTQASWKIYDHLLSSNSFVGDPGSTGDILAWDSVGEKSVPMRDSEISFIAPDQFDLTYYSIEPDFWRNYALRLKKRSDFSNIHVRGDLGYHRGGGAPWDTMTIKDQMERARTAPTRYDYGVLSYYAGADKTPALAFTELLTSWHMNGPGDYKLTQNRFGNCLSGMTLPDDNMSSDIAIPGNCMAGGRTGYSVKIVDGEYLQKSNLEIGGQGQTGRLMNSWTDSISDD